MHRNDILCESHHRTEKGIMRDDCKERDKLDDPKLSDLGGLPPRAADSVLRPRRPLHYISDTQSS